MLMLLFPYPYPHCLRFLILWMPHPVDTGIEKGIRSILWQLDSTSSLRCPLLPTGILMKEWNEERELRLYVITLTNLH